MTKRSFQKKTKRLSQFIMAGVLLGGTYSANAGNLVCELEIETVKDRSSTGEVRRRVAEELSFETYLYDVSLDRTWVDLFSVLPNSSSDDIVILQGRDKTVTWPAGVLEMAGLMKIKVKTDKDSGLKEIKIKRIDNEDGVTRYVNGTGGVNAQSADAGWHEVEVEKMDNVSVIIDGIEVIGFLKKLEVELDESSTVGAPVVKEFELKLKAATQLPDVKKGFVSQVIVNVPATTVTAVGGTAYEEETDEEPFLLGGHVEAEYERGEHAVLEGVLIDSLNDGFNDQLEEREGPCEIGSSRTNPGTPPGRGGPASGTI